MGLTRDELAGIVGLFGGLTRPELERAYDEMAFKRTGSEPTREAVDEQMTAALESYHLVPVETRDDELLVPGPAAFPTVPEGADDLPHILELNQRPINRTPVAERIRDEALAELETDPGQTRREEIRQLAYDLETWSTVEADRIRERLESLEE